MFDFLAALFITTAHASNYQQCLPSSTCTIGEFLYNDDYTALPGQSCTLTAKTPDGTVFISNEPMTDRGDGWYSYDAIIGTPTGLYSSTMCCTPSTGLMCLDKSFEVKPASTSGGSTLTAEDVWSYSDRTLTSYGTLISDIWSYSSRSLTSLGSLVSDIWNYSGRTLTSFDFTQSSTPAPGTLQNIVAEQQTQRELLERLVNAPVVSLSLDDGGNIPNLETKLNDSKTLASSLYDTISSAKSRLMLLDSKWAKLSPDAAVDEITSVASLFQNEDRLATLIKSWDSPSLSTLNTELTQLQSTLAAIITSTTISKTQFSPVDLTSSLEHLIMMETALGDSTNHSSDPTFFGYLSFVSDRASNLESENQKLRAILENLNGQGENLADREVTRIKSRLLTLNQYPGGESLAEPAKISDNNKLNLKNILFSLQALVGLNRQILAMNVGDPVRSLWLEEGSIIFRAIITNPSKVISQSVPLKFYLPRELKESDIITLDPSLETIYDSGEEALYVKGDYNLKPGETKLVFVEVEDIWQLSPSELETIRTQAINLLKPLEKTAYFSQGTTLKSDIDVTLDKVALSTSKAVTPENRIRAYREAKLELTKVTSNMNRLEDLVAQSSGTGSLFGFVGGVQTVAVWGIILVVVGGFVFLSLYFKRLQPVHLGPTKPDLSQVTDSPGTTTHLTPLILPKSSDRGNWQMPAIISAVVVVTAISTIALTRLASPANPEVNQLTTLPSPSPTPSPSVLPSSTPSPLPSSIDIKHEKAVLGEESANLGLFTLTVPEDSTVNLRNKPNSNADIITSIKDTTDVYIFKETGDWRQIGFKESDLTKGYWVHSQFITEK
jgi:hypothetical protein